MIFGILRVSYERFYEVFGLTPEDVGTSSGSILSQSGFGVFGLVLVIFGPFLVGCVTAGRAIRSGPLRWLVMTAILIPPAVLTYVAFLHNLTIFAAEAGTCAKQGYAVRSVRGESGFLSLGRVTLVAVRAEQIKLHWLSTEQPAPQVGTPLMYLGQDSGGLYLFDVEQQATLRVPQAKAYIEFMNDAPDPGDDPVCADARYGD